MMPMSTRSFPVHQHTKVGREHQQEHYLERWSKAPIFVKTSCMQIYICNHIHAYTLKFQSLQYKNIHTRWNIDHIAVIHLWIHKTFLLNMGNLIISDITTSRFSRVICLQDFFEAVLGQQSCYWTAISRSHLVLTEVDPGSFLVQRLDQKKWQMLVENHSPHYFFGYFFNKFWHFLFIFVFHSHPLRNLSVNHVMVAGRHLQKGQQTTTQVTWQMLI